MDVSVSVSCFHDELASTVERAFKAAVDTVLWEITKTVGGRFAEKEKENEKLKLRLEMSERELRAMRECLMMSAARSPPSAVSFSRTVQNYTEDGTGTCVRVREQLNDPRVAEDRAFAAEQRPVLIEEVETKENLNCDEIGERAITDVPEIDSATSSCGRQLHRSSVQRRPVYLPSWITDSEDPRFNRPETQSTVSGPGVRQPDPVQASQRNRQPEPPFAFGEFEQSFQRFDPQPAPRDGRWGWGDPSPSGNGRNQPAGSSPSYHCPECAKSFTNLRNLKTHRLIHSGEKPYQCGQCGKSFRQMGAVRKHQRIHTGEKPYQCTECGKSFNELGNLRKHQRIHAGVKPFHCTVCGRRFVQSEHLKKHRRTHTGEKPHRCPRCWQGFTDLHRLKNHQCSLTSA